MKKIICIVLSLLLSMVFVTCFAETEDDNFGNPFAVSEEPTYYICRSNVKCRSLENEEEFVTLHFGEIVNILEKQEEYTIIEYGDGQKGKVTTGFIVETFFPMLYIGPSTYLSPIAYMTPADFGYGACGMRYEERAIVLFQEEAYLFIVTEEGFSGYVRADTPTLSVYIEE